MAAASVATSGWWVLATLDEDGDLRRKPFRRKAPRTDRPNFNFGEA